MSRTFEAADAQEARNGRMLPLLVGLTGPSGSGKTFSALRLATGIQSVVGGDIFVIDTEQRRSLHYAERFKFKHVEFGAPFGALDYLEALRFAKKAGAGVVVIDSCSHEHDGPGGLLEQHEAELTRMAGNDYGKRERMTMLAWQKPKAGRRKLIAALTSELDLPTIFCFRAKNTTKPMKDERTGKQMPVDMGFTSIAADEWVFEMALSALLLPGSCGVPTWQSDKIGERLAIKLPEQFKSLAEPPPHPLDEKIGRRLALWAKGEKAAPAKPAERFQAQPTAAAEEAAGHAPQGETGEAAAPVSEAKPRRTPAQMAAAYQAKIAECADIGALTELQTKSRDWLASLLEIDAKLHGACVQAGLERMKALIPPPAEPDDADERDTQTGSMFEGEGA